MLASSLGKAGYTLGLSVWLVIVFVLSQFVVGLVFYTLQSYIPALAGLNSAVAATLLAALVYAASIAVLLLVPYLVKKQKVSRETLGLQRAMSWSDIAVGALAVVPYFIISGLLITGISMLWSGFNANQEQVIPFENVTLRYEMIVAFLTLVVIAPIAEEMMFRGYLLGAMSKKINRWLAVIITALVFGALHLFAFTDTGVSFQWAVAIDTMALGTILGLLRIFTGSIWAGVLLHMIKNAIAYYFLFIYPTMPGTL